MTNHERDTGYDAIVIGGGFFGCSIALFLSKTGMDVVVLEERADLMERASYANQARIHNGYHYPRSILTALRSRLNFPRFISDYAACVYDEFDQYYAVGRYFSKVSANQYKRYFERIGAEIEAVKDRRILGLFNLDLVEEVFLVKEYAFDADRLRTQIWEDLQNAGVDVRLNCKVMRLNPGKEGEIEVICQRGGEQSALLGRSVYNCTYSRINQLLGDSHLPLIRLKHEVTELALVEMPGALSDLGVTIMCGPFFSFMPFPARPGLHSLSHVRYTPHVSWQESEAKGYLDAYAYLSANPRRSNFPQMLKDAQRYIPALQDCRYIDSIWEVKTVLPQSEVDDSRPILMKRDQGIPNLTCIMGGKIDNIYDVFEELSLQHLQ
jgi:glycine/D-amino acid oxidase-like deaminating enzyme